MNQPMIDVDEKPRAAKSHSAPSTRIPSNESRGSAPESKGKSIQRRLFENVLATVGHPALLIELPRGEVISPRDPAVPVVGRLRFLDDRALWRVITDPMFQFPEMYSAGRIAIDGPIDQIVIEIFHAMRRAGHRSTWLGKWIGMARWPRRTSLRAAKENIHHHYDIGNEFYKLWLDKRMAYTCAYFPRPDASLEEAQTAKFDHVCRKLRLTPNMNVIEAGCGWGGLALHMARQYGVRVQAYNISHEQIVYARQCAQAEGLGDRIEFVEADWREMRGSCDAFASIGMLEHVGPRHYRQLGGTIDRLLRPGGRGIIHSIGQNFPCPASPWIERRIFPGGYPPALSEMMAIFESNEFSVLDVENLRLHYAQTLRHWLQQFEQHEPQVRAMFDEPFVRMWRFYLAGSLASFETGSYQLFQIVFNRAADNDVALTRDYLYRTFGDPTSAKGRS